jgi:ribosome biogenesis GTPase
MIIDNPGMRELQLISGGTGLKQTFSDIEEIARNCKFSDCGHLSEPGCAVKKALELGEITKEHLENYDKLRKETRYTNLSTSLKSSRAVEKAKWDTIFNEANKKEGINHKERAKQRKKMKK